MKATYRDHGGTDLSVVNAARVSFDNQSDWELHQIVGEDGQGRYVDTVKRLKQKDVNLINYLARGLPKSEWEGVIHGLVADVDYSTVEYIVQQLMLMAQHWVPFTHTFVTLHMVAPVPIARQCFKHKVGFTESEESRRYISTTPTLYIPDEFRSVAKNVKQGSGGKHYDSDHWVDAYTKQCNDALDLYDTMINDKVAPEQARFVLPQGCEVQWIWSGNIASFARYVNQRTDSHAQLESQVLAQQVSDIIRPLFPVSWDALVRSGRVDAE